MRVLKIASLLFLFVLSGCPNEDPSSVVGSDVASFSPGVRRQLRNMDVAGAINTVMSGPTQCGGELVQGASAGMNWEQFEQNSRKSGITYDGPYGRVEFYNGSIHSLPGGMGITAVGGEPRLDRSILDIMPLLAIAHKRKGLPVRVSHTTGGKHSTNSLHYKGRAIDIDPHPASRRMAVAEEIRNVLASSGRGCGYFVLVEASHIHVSYKGPSYSGCPGFAVDI